MDAPADRLKAVEDRPRRTVSVNDARKARRGACRRAIQLHLRGSPRRQNVPRLKLNQTRAEPEAEASFAHPKRFATFQARENSRATNTLLQYQTARQRLECAKLASAFNSGQRWLLFPWRLNL